MKLTDFGIARALDGTVANCTTFVGTHKYMSPARMRSEPYSYVVPPGAWCYDWGWGCSRMVILAISPSTHPLFPYLLYPSSRRTSLTLFTPLSLTLSLPTGLSTCTGLPTDRPLPSAYLHSPPAHTATNNSYPADVWSLGIMLIEFVTGEYPLANTSIMLDMMKAIEEKDPLLAIRAAPDMYSEELVSFCESCVVRDPVMRASTEALLRHPWMELHGASSVAGCIVRVREYFEEEERYAEKCAEKDGEK